MDGRTITADIDVTIEGDQDGVPAQVPVMKEQHLLDAVNLALVLPSQG